MTKLFLSKKNPRILVFSLALLLAGGCTSLDKGEYWQRTRQLMDAKNPDQSVSLVVNEDQKRARANAVAEILKEPLTQSSAVKLTLLNSSALQALLARSWENASYSAQKGQAINPLFSFESVRGSSDLEIQRLLSFGLIDLITLPARRKLAEAEIEQSQVQTAQMVLSQAYQVRQAWVRAVSAKQSLVYAEQVYASAEAGADLAKRMEKAGNFSRIERARHQSFYAEAAVGLMMAKRQVLATREELIRRLGLSIEQVALLRLPDTLPPIPSSLIPTTELDRVAQRLDIQLAKLQLRSAAGGEDIVSLSRWTDVELAIQRGTTGAGTQRGFNLGVRVPLFDWGQWKSEGAKAKTLAAAYELEATVQEAASQVRESYLAYRAAHDIATHYRDEIIPLRKVISDENLLRYNGMFISVFELLADARSQAGAVTSAIEAYQQFWLAESNLQSSILGVKMEKGGAYSSPAGGSGEAGQ